MHYRNGREAAQGDKVINLETGQSGIIHTLNASAGTCNARLAALSHNDAYVTLADCVHADDVAAAFPPAAKG